MEEQNINYVCIKSYNYKMDDLMKFYKNFFEIIKNCKLEYDEYEKDKDESKITRDKLINYSRLEILKTDTMCRFFLDVENLKDNDVAYIQINDKFKYPKFLEDFEVYMGFRPRSFTITLNNNSEHNGYSYHVIWPYIIKFGDIKKYIIDFINHNTQYAGYIDSSIYSSRRIFRCPYQHKPALKKNGRRINDYHKIIFSNGIDDIDNNLDISISNSIIQNIFNLENVNKDVNINYDDMTRYNTIYRETRKKESDQLKPKQLEDKENKQEDLEPLEKKNEHIDNNINIIDKLIEDVKNSGIDMNNPNDILNLVSQMINKYNSQ